MDQFLQYTQNQSKSVQMKVQSLLVQNLQGFRQKWVKEIILVRAQWTVFSIVKVLHKPQNDLLYIVYFFSCTQAESTRGGERKWTEKDLWKLKRTE